MLWRLSVDVVGRVRVRFRYMVKLRVNVRVRVSIRVGISTTNTRILHIRHPHPHPHISISSVAERMTRSHQCRQVHLSGILSAKRPDTCHKSVQTTHRPHPWHTGRIVNCASAPYSRKWLTNMTLDETHCIKYRKLVLYPCGYSTGTICI